MVVSNVVVAALAALEVSENCATAVVRISERSIGTCRPSDCPVRITCTGIPVPSTPRSGPRMTMSKARNKGFSLLADK